MNYSPFTNLYQEIKQKDPRLFETLQKIDNYLSILFKASDLGFNRIQYATANANLVLTNVSTTIPGAFINLSIPGDYLVVGNFDFTDAGDVGFSFTGELRVGGIQAKDLAGNPITTNVTSTLLSNRLSSSQVWKITVGTQKISLFAQKAGGAGASTANATNTTITAILI